MTIHGAAIHGSVHVVDDDVDLALSVARLLARHGFSASAYHDARSFLAHAAIDGASCLVSDVMIGETNGLDLARQVRQSRPTMAVLFMTNWPRVTDAVEAIRDLDGIDYLEKPLDQDRLIGAVARGLAWSAARYAREQKLVSLSSRERQIFDLLVRGRTNKTVAAQLGLSIKTVEDHRAAIMRKTGALSLAQLIDLKT
jgi:FixJ family two-component response regulator